MKISYDPKVDAMYIKFRRGNYEVSEELDESTIIDFDKSGNLLAIELLDVSQRTSLKDIKNMKVDVVDTKTNMV